jgi:photosystem II stability/assembly factor-like uncharacterized protein
MLLFSSVAISLSHTYHGVSMVPNTEKGWVVTSDTNGYVLHTPDCGLSWISQSFSTSRYLYDVFFLNEQKGWVGTSDGFIYYSPNGGQNWYRQVMGLAYFAFRVLFINDTCGWVACSGAVIARTVCGNDTVINGVIWQSTYLPYAADSIELHGVSFINEQTGWFCTGHLPEFWWPDTNFTKGQGYIAVSNDSGISWQLQKRDTINDFFDIKMLDSLNGFVIGGNDRTMSATVMKTQNGGVTWQPLTIPSQAKYLRSMKIIGTNKIWAVGHSGTILHSDNGGNNWVLQTSPVDTILYDIDFSDSIHGLIAGDGCVLYTHDGGNSWHIANLGIEETRLPLIANRIPLKIYPNPATSIIHISCPFTVKEIKIFDVTGKLVKSEELKGKSNRIPLKGIKSGVYFVKIGNQLVKEKIVVTK